MKSAELAVGDTVRWVAKSNAHRRPFVIVRVERNTRGTVVRVYGGEADGFPNPAAWAVTRAA